MTPNLRTAAWRAGLLLSTLALGACAGFTTTPPGRPGPTGEPPATPKSAELISYFEMLDQLAPGDPTRQASTLEAIRLAAMQSPTSSNQLHYAIALGSAGPEASNPVEARRRISELLASPHDLRPQELLLAKAYLREFDARVALYAELARQREEGERKLKAQDTEADRRYNALNGETQKLRKALAEAERKLEAIAEVERLLTPEGQ